MTHREPRNVAASVHQRLLNQARVSGRPFNELLQYFAMERFLFRLSRSPHVGTLVLKGGLMLTTWNISPTRPTKDIDLLGHVANDVERIADIIRDICREEVAPDGMAFDPTTIDGVRIAETAEYEGVRARFLGHLGKARVTMQVDVGFGDIVVPAPVMLEYPTILELPAPRVRGYTRGSMVAEKFHTMALRGVLNSRMRDYFDVWALSRQFNFDGSTLATAIRETFSARHLMLAPNPVALSAEFSADTTKAAQWKGFLRNNLLATPPDDLGVVVAQVADFLGPVAAALTDGREFAGRWEAPGPWDTEDD